MPMHKRSYALQGLVCVGEVGPFSTRQQLLVRHDEMTHWYANRRSGVLSSQEHLVNRPKRVTRGGGGAFVSLKGQCTPITPRSERCIWELVRSNRGTDHSIANPIREL